MTTPGIDVPGWASGEGRFTAPTERCPYPNRWTSTDGDSTECEVSELVYGLVRALQPGLCVETGSGFGQTSLAIATALDANRHGFLFTLEIDDERAAATEDLLRPFGRAHVLRQSSLDWEPPFPLDFAWLDSWYELRVPEFMRFHPFMRPGTIVCFHDTAPEHGSHRIASGRDLHTEIRTELCGLIDYIRLPTPRGLTIAEVM